VCDTIHTYTCEDEEERGIAYWEDLTECAGVCELCVCVCVNYVCECVCVLYSNIYVLF